MAKSMTLNRADIAQLLKILNLDYFELIKNDSSGIGYTLDIEHKVKGETIRIPAITVEEW